MLRNKQFSLPVVWGCGHSGPNCVALNGDPVLLSDSWSNSEGCQDL